jgi:hypothetical protein
MIKSVLGKFWILYLFGAIVQSVIVIVVLLQFLAYTHSQARYLFNFIYDTLAAVGGSIALSFIIDWAEVLSITVVYIVFIPTFKAIMENRRKHALDRVHIWASDAVLELTRVSSEGTVEKNLADYEEKLRRIIDEGDNDIAGSITLDNELKPKVTQAVKNLLELEECFNNHTELDDIKALLQTTVISFKEISSSTYNSVSQLR